MAPPAPEPVRRGRNARGSPEPVTRRSSRLVVNQAVLAGRNPGSVVPVGAWIEPADWGTESRALVSAEEVEEKLVQYQQEKQQRLIRFQGEVKRRVNQHVKQRKRQQLQKSYDALAREGVIIKQSSDAAVPFTPKRNTCIYRNTQVAICCSRSVPAQKIDGDFEEDREERDENGNKLFRQHSKLLKKSMRQVRDRLAALKTVEIEELTLPGGIWKVSPTRDNPISRKSPILHRPDAEDEESLLRGHHDLPVELLAQDPEGQLRERVHAVPPGKPVCHRLMKEPYPTGPAPAYNTDYHAALVLRPGVDEEESRKQRQNQYLMYRRLFMDIEREQVKETRRQKEHERKISKMKREREAERQVEEQRLCRAARPDTPRNVRELETLLETTEQHRERRQKTKEHNRYVDALRAQMKDKMTLHNIELPPLCCCGTDFWDAHPDTCANNCMFYKNPKAYTRALQSVLSSRDTWDGNASSRFSACNISSSRPRSLK
ncbi:coiled-coil domain-containing protein 15 isoform X1 [Pseudophryne corroboree]|uniref:coiled-coil domain-containing protein 15 isoform X1 n=1 Tax=Pseudophryne corroboree TaxID=495146 RepID=UPI00308166BC